jgi:UDP-glucose 4-epimerase
MVRQIRCVILGGGGFIGSHVVDALVAKGHFVRIFERQNLDTRNIEQVLGRIEFIKGDFLNEDDLCRAVAGMEVIVHLISSTLPKSSNDNVIYDVETNVIGTLKMLNIAKREGVRKIVFASSGGTIYGHQQGQPIMETYPTNPICSYGIAKLTIEKYLHLNYFLHGMDYTVLRIANPYGCRQDPTSGQGALVIFLWHVLNRRTIEIWGDGSVARDYFYVSDLVSALLAAIELETPSKIYNIGSGVSHSLNELLSIIKFVTGQSPIVQYSQARKLDVSNNFLDISRARKELNWQPVISLEEGIQRTWAWIQHLKRD